MDGVHFQYLIPETANYSGLAYSTDNLQNAIMLHPLLGSCPGFRGYVPPRKTRAFKADKVVQTKWRQKLKLHTFSGGRLTLVTPWYSLRTTPSSNRVPHNRLTVAELAGPREPDVGMRLPTMHADGGPAVLLDGTLSPRLFS